MSGVTVLSGACALLLEGWMIFVFFETGRVFPLGGTGRVGVGLVASAAVIALWMAFAAPMSSRRLAMPELLLFMAAVCGVAAVILGKTHPSRWWIVFVAFSVLSLTMEYVAA